MRVCLVRHGETAWSITGQHTGLTDLGLTARGEAEPRALKSRLRAMAFTQILVSPRLRARQTCGRAGLGTASAIEPKLAEWDYGDYEGLRSADIRTDTPDWNIWRDGWPSGESPADVSARADRLIASLCEMQSTLALFTHGQFGAARAARWIGLMLVEGKHFAMNTGSVSLLGIDPHHPAVQGHGLRATFASIAEEVVSGGVLKRMMNHAGGGDVTIGHYVGKS